MKATWIPVGSVVAIILGLGVLEVVSEGVRVDEPSPTAWRSREAPTPSGLTPDDLLTLDLGPGTAEMMHSVDGDDR